MKKIYTEPEARVITHMKGMTIATSIQTSKNDRMHGIGSHSKEFGYDGEAGDINDDSFWSTK